METVMIMMMRTVVIKWMIARNGDLEDEREREEQKEKNGKRKKDGMDLEKDGKKECVNVMVVGDERESE